MEQAVAALLQDTLDPARSRDATRALETAALQRGFAISLLQISGAPAVPEAVRQAAATCFKNHVRRYWDDSESPALTAEDRAAIKAGIVRLMLAVPKLVQRQLSEALAHVSKFDFPDLWPTLLPELVSEISAARDYAALLGLLETVQAVFERFRGAYNTDENRRPLKYAVDTFAAPLTERYRLVDARAEEAARAGAPKAEQDALAHARRIMCSIFYLLNWLEPPEYFEDHLSEWVGWFHKALVEQNAVTTSAADDVDAGALEQLKGAALEAVELYADKHEEEFEPFFPTVLQDVWTLLAGGSMPEAKLMSANMDGLVTRAVKFVASVATKQQHAPIFAQDGFIRELLARVVVPNTRLRPRDLEDFEDDPEDFMRGDIEGNNNDTRRRVATDLVRALCKSHNDITTPLCVETVARLLAEYEAARNERVAAKDAAVALFCAVAAKTATEASGVTSVNERASLGEFLSGHVLTELQLQPGETVDSRPLAKAAAIKFVATFRGLFSRDNMHALLPLLVPFMGASSFVVHTYAAAAIERMLTVRDAAPAGAGAGAGAGGAGAAAPAAAVAPAGRGGVPRVATEALLPLVPALLTSLFGKIARADYPENEYLMRCLMRVVVLSRAALAPLAPQIIAALTQVLARVCGNPSNPVYNHFLFETIAALMRAVCAERPAAATDFEAMLMPPFQAVLARDVQEFLPYVFQLLAELLALQPGAAGAGPSDGFKQLLAPCLSPALWQRRGCVPALTDLVAAFLHRGAGFVVEAGHVLPVLGLFQRLMTTKNQEQFGFALLNALFVALPAAQLQPHLVTLLQITLTRVQQSKALRVARMFVHAAALLAGTHGAAALEGPLEALGAGTFANIVENVVAATGNRIPGDAARREAAVGLARVLCETPSFFADASRQAAWQKLLCTVVELCTGAAPADAAAAALAASARAAQQLGGGNAHFAEEEDEDDPAADGAEQLPAEYEAAFSRLRHAAVRRPYAFAAQAPDARAFVGASLSALSARGLPAGMLASLIAASPVAANANALVVLAGGRL